MRSGPLDLQVLRDIDPLRARHSSSNKSSSEVVLSWFSVKDVRDSQTLLAHLGRLYCVFIHVCIPTELV
jgi:hypothetical protein